MQFKRATSTGVLVSVLLVITVRMNAERLPIKTYTASDGLPRDLITHIVQDSKGFLWFCTSEGLARFDGYKFTNYGTAQGLAGRHVNGFLETRDGVYWVATDKGLCRFNPDPLPRQGGGAQDSYHRFTVFYPGETRYIIVIYEDHAGTIWCGTYAGLFRLDQNGGQWVFSFVDIIEPLAAETDRLRVDSITEDRRGSLWIGASSGLYRRRPDGVVERYTAKEGLPEHGIARALLEDSDGRIWDGTRYGLYQLVPDPQPGRCGDGCKTWSKHTPRNLFDFQGEHQQRCETFLLH